MAVSRRMWLKEQERKKRERARRARIKRNIALGVVLIAAVVVALILVKGCTADKASVDDGHITAAVTAAPNAQPDAAASVPPETTNNRVDTSAIDKKFFDNAVFVGNAVVSGISRYGLLPATDFYAGVSITLENVYNTAANNSSMPVIDQLKSKKFTKVILSFGELELTYNDAEEFSRQYGELIEKVKAYQPGSNIYVIAIPPVAQSSGYDIAAIRAYNAELKALAVSEKLYYVDSTAVLRNSNGYLPEGISADGVNLNPSCYVDLLSYISKKAKIPDRSSLEEDQESDTDAENADEESDSYSDEDEDSSQPSRMDSEENADDQTEASPEPTVNVFKDSAINE